MSKTTHFDQLMQVDIGLIRGKVSEVVERGLKERRSILAQSRRSQEGMIDTIISEVKQAYVEVASRKKQITIAEKAVKSAQSSFVLNRTRIFERQGFPIEMLQAIQSLASARQYYVNTVTAFNQAQYRLYTSLGQSLSNQK